MVLDLVRVKVWVMVKVRGSGERDYVVVMFRRFYRDQIVTTKPHPSSFYDAVIV